MPFENSVVVCELKGRDVYELINYFHGQKLSYTSRLQVCIMQGLLRVLHASSSMTHITYSTDLCVNDNIRHARNRQLPVLPKRSYSPPPPKRKCSSSSVPTSLAVSMFPCCQVYAAILFCVLLDNNDCHVRHLSEEAELNGKRLKSFSSPLRQSVWFRSKRHSIYIYYVCYDYQYVRTY